MSADIFHAQILADGYLPAAKATLYTASKRVIIKSITLVNEDAGGRIANLYLNKSGTSRRIIPKNMTLGPSFKGEDDSTHSMSPGDQIEGDSDAPSKVSYLIEGAISE